MEAIQILAQANRHIARLQRSRLFYLSGNYFAVRELSEELLHTHIGPGQDISLAWFFYAWTFIVPILSSFTD
jgi:hypothetical protein